MAVSKLRLATLDDITGGGGSSSDLVVDWTASKYGGAAADGTWDAAIAAAVADLGDASAGSGGILTAPPAIYQVANPVQVYGGQYLVGTGYDYAGIGTTRSAPQRGVVLQAAPAFPNTEPLVKFGTVQYNSADPGPTMLSGLVAGGAVGITFDAATYAQSAAQTYGSRFALERCNFISGASYALDIQGQNTRVMNCSADNFGAAGTLATVHINAVDCKYWNNETRASYGPSILIDTATNFQIVGGDHYGPVGGGTDHPVIKLQGSMSGGTIADCFVDYYLSGAGNDVIGFYAGSGQTLSGFLIANVRSYYNFNAFVGFTSSGGQSSNVTIANCIGSPISGNPTAGVLVSSHSGASCPGLVLVDNNFPGMKTGASLINGTGITPAVCRGNVWGVEGSSTVYKTEDGGTETLTGDASTAAFPIPHAINAAPAHFTVRAKNAAAATALAGGWFWSADATNITLTFLTAPAAGDLDIEWEASQF